MKQKYQIQNILIPIAEKQDIGKDIAAKCKLSASEFSVMEILKKSVDARQKHRILYHYTVLIETSAPLKISADIAIFKEPIPYIQPFLHLKNPHPYIIGAGPAGLFTALTLVEKGFSPYLFERGDEMDIRSKKVNHFWQTGELDAESNVQFGEGGAGAFSDGKLTARNRDYYSTLVFDYLIRFGAPPEISYEALPHLGTDKIRQMIKSIRQYLIAQGCQFFFRHRLEKVEINQNKVEKVMINGQYHQPEALFLAIGNAARDLFIHFENRIPLAPKAFAVGFRIEHPQSFINESIWGKNADLTLLGNAAYRFTHRHNNRGVYSFCMCPGGFVIASSSAAGQVVTNGMSFLDRTNHFANSAIVAEVQTADFGDNILGGIEFQKKIEEKAFIEANPFAAPIQTAQDFMNFTSSKIIPPSSYQPGTYLADFSQLFPANITNILQAGLAAFDKKMPGFIKNGMLIGPETRTSSPLRIIRDKELFCSTAASNLFPIGEGAGYAGGIISSAADGIKAAMTIKPK